MKQVIHCPTKELWEKVQEKMFKDGGKWFGGGDTILDNWGCYEQESCLSIENRKIQYCDIPYFKKNSYTIIEAEDYLREKFKNLSAEEQGIDTSRYFVQLPKEECFDKNPMFAPGDLIKISGGKETANPYFERVKDREEHSEFWANLRYATQEEIDAVLGKDTPKIKNTLTDNTCISDVEKYNIIDLTEYTYKLESIYNKPNQSIIKKTMNKVTRFIKNATLSPDEKLLREQGLKNECGEYTDAYEEVRNFLLNQEYEKKVVEQVKAQLESEKDE